MKADRRDHHPDPGPMRQGITLCRTCGERLREVYDRSLPVSTRRYWRHWRRT